jgi:hypothetical protein
VTFGNEKCDLGCKGCGDPPPASVTIAELRDEFEEDGRAQDVKRGPTVWRNLHFSRRWKCCNNVTGLYIMYRETC